jgi:hypothetical protein
MEMQRFRQVGTGRRGRLVRIASGAAIVVAGVLVAFGAPAFGHEVTGIDVDCTNVTVHWSGFPDAGVSVHIAADVEGIGSTSTDVMVNHNSSQTQLNISALTDQLHGASGTVDVDVTWTFEGPQHVSATEHVTCGTAPTTTTTVHVGESTTIPPTTTTTTMPESTTTTSTTSTTVSAGASTTTSTVFTGGQIVTPTTISVSPAEAVNTSAAVSPTGTTNGSLPFTGTNPWLIVLGLGMSVSGAALVAAPKLLARKS